jgi:3-hydroxyacyl-CoA dehydrogenase
MSHINVSSVTVLGAGTMGAQIALHFANVGIPSLLLDLTADVARQGLDKARALKPDPQFAPDAYSLITTGGFDTHMDQIAATDWVMEAVVERLDIKQQLLARVDEQRRRGTIVSTNTSGIPIAALAAGRSEDFRRHWLGTHFFNPPRYLRLLELIPTAETDPSVINAVTRVGDHLLGKGVVVAKDTPNFIGNHIALYGVACMLRALATGKYTIEEIDAITGPAIGRPGSATFRTMDIAGVDVLAHVMRNLHERLADADDRAAFAVPAFVDRMIARGQLGEKSGKGFYQRRKNDKGESEIWTLDLETLDYRPKTSAKIGSIDAGKSMDDLGDRIRMLFASTDKAGEFLRETLAPTLVYTARVTPEIAHSIDDVDRVMRWGFGWDLGPFELFDTLGVREVMAAASAVGGHAARGGVPPLVQSVLEAQANRFREGLVAPAAADLQILRSAKDQQRVLKKNAGASLVDLGDGVLAVEFHSKMNVIGGDTIAMLQAGVKEAAKNHRALVIGNDAPTFSAGANLMLVLLEAQEGNFDELDVMVRQFQQAMMMLRYSEVPVVVAPGGLTLGGGMEMVLHGDRVQAAAETYMGLVEVGVGLIPAGGGTKEMLVRAMAGLPTPQSDPLPYVQKAFETVALAKVSASGPDAVRLGYLSATDSFTMNRERLMADAKAKALERVREGYHTPAPRTAIRVGGESVSAALKLGVHLAWRAGRASDHDALIGRKLAHIFGGGALPHPTTVSEQYLLDLEREAFLGLLGEPKTLLRIQHTLKTGKPLRN